MKSELAAVLKGAAAVALAVVALSGGVAAWRNMHPEAGNVPDIAGYVIQPAKKVPAFSLVDGNGTAFTNDAFEGNWSFLYFGYTYCPDMCPLSMIELSKVKQMLEGTHPRVTVHYYLVSVDPARDTPERLREYVAYFDPSFRGLTGDREEIDKLAGAASVAYMIPEAAPGAPYLVGHSSTITLIDPDGKVHAIFTTPLEAERIAADFAQIVMSYDRP